MSRRTKRGPGKGKKARPEHCDDRYRRGWEDGFAIGVQTAIEMAAHIPALKGELVKFKARLNQEVRERRQQLSRSRNGRARRGDHTSGAVSKSRKAKERTNAATALQGTATPGQQGPGDAIPNGQRQPSPAPVGKNAVQRLSRGKDGLGLGQASPDGGTPKGRHSLTQGNRRMG